MGFFENLWRNRRAAKDKQDKGKVEGMVDAPASDSQDPKPAENANIENQKSSTASGETTQDKPAVVKAADESASKNISDENQTSADLPTEGEEKHSDQADDKDANKNNGSADNKEQLAEHVVIKDVAATTDHGTALKQITEDESHDSVQNRENEEHPKAEDMASVEDEDSSEVVDYGVLADGTKMKTFSTRAEQGAEFEQGKDTLVLAILNQKGGVGKSTTAINLSAALGGFGKKILLVDLDPQGNSTSGLGIDKTQIIHDVYEILLDDLPVDQAVLADVCEGMDVLPATIELSGAEVELVTEMAREQRLKNAIDPLRGRYDYVFIDCPPSLGLLTINALVAADKVIIPVQCEFYALEGVTKLLESMNRVKSRLNAMLDIFGVLLTMYDSRTILSKQVADEVRKYFGSQVFDSVIPRSVKVAEAPSYGQPITEYDPTGKGAEAYVSLAKEVINRG